MPTFQDFIAEIDKAGIIIEGRDEFIDTVKTSAHWPSAVSALAYGGRKQGIRLIRHAVDSPSDEEIHRILRGYSFSQDQRNSVVQNVIAVG